MNDYRTEAPPILRDFLSYHETIKAHSRKTVDEYFLDLRNFFRYLKQTRDPSLRGLELNEISILDVDLDFVSSVTLTDIYGYMTYLSRERVLHQNSDASGYGLNAASRARKIATIRSFYKYLTNKVHLIKENPVKDLDSPKLKKTLPHLGRKRAAVVLGGRTEPRAGLLHPDALSELRPAYFRALRAQHHGHSGRRAARAR